MNKVFCMVTALPPTKGHERLVRFAKELGVLNLIVCTQPNEPFARERVAAFRTLDPYITVHHIDDFIEQNPKSDNFKTFWANILRQFGCEPGDYIVASEDYGLWLAEMTGASFIPYDPYREILDCKATNVRAMSEEHFDLIMPTFQPNVRQTVTFFGAESTGKSTMSKLMAADRRGHFLFEWARPYLEVVGSELTVKAMTDIWHGQRALQDHAYNFVDKPWVFQDTDLFTTVGYWDFWWDRNRYQTDYDVCETPNGLVHDAALRKSDLYIITLSNIPFEVDPLRYGGTERESTDQYWIDLCEHYKLNYRVLQSHDIPGRIHETHEILDEHWKVNVSDKLVYTREFN